MTTLRPTRYSTCGSLSLPVQFACDKCKVSIENALRKNLKAKKIKRCDQSWDIKWRKHQLKDKEK